MNPDIYHIVQGYLGDLGYDGLYNESKGCSCAARQIAPDDYECITSYCKAGYYAPGSDRIVSKYSKEHYLPPDDNYLKLLKDYIDSVDLTEHHKSILELQYIAELAMQLIHRLESA